MTPFGDEGRIVGDLCSAGDVWHQQMMKDMLVYGTTYNAYSTQIERLATPDGVDCWLGKLVSTGIVSQVQCTRVMVAQIPLTCGGYAGTTND
jgi:hypothetical protein